MKVSVVVQQIIPAMRYAVNDDYLGTRLLADRDSLDVGFGGIVVECEDLITAQVSLEVGRTILGVDNCELRPVARHTIGDKK